VPGEPATAGNAGLGVVAVFAVAGMALAIRAFSRTAVRGE